MSETSIDISPGKKLSHYHDDYEVTKKTKNNEGVKKIVSGGESSAEKLKKSSPKRTKSQSLINSLISLSPSSTFSVGKKNTNMEQETGSSGGSKKKRKNIKKVNNKRADSKETMTTTKVQNSADDRSLEMKVEQINNENNDDDLSSKTTPNAALTRPQISGGEQRRKSSEDFKELRKNAGVLPQTNGVAELEESTFVGEASAVPEKHFGVEGRDDEDEANKESADNNEVDETDGDETTACTDSFRQLKPFNYDLEPVEEVFKLFLTFTYLRI